MIFCRPYDPNSYVATGNRPTFAIAGGGYSAAVVAWTFDRATPGRHNIVIIEPRSEIYGHLWQPRTGPTHQCAGAEDESRHREYS